MDLISKKPTVNVGGAQALNIKNQLANINNRTITNYEKRITEAKQRGDYQTADAMQDLLDNYYTTNGISPTTGLAEQPTATTPEEIFEERENQLNEKYDVAFKALDNDYVSMYTTAINDVANGIMAQVGNLMNFQYDPAKDRALHIAQGYAVGKVKETMNATGMYYSTMTQTAITRAITELVPVYEKMARDEIQTNIQALYNLGNYLMNLDSHQFDIYKQQVAMKLEEIEQRRKDTAEAWERANMLGYIDNQASAILGIPAGTLTYKARQDAQDRQDALDRELRGYENQEYIARLNSDLQKERNEQEAKLELEKLRESSRLQDQRDAKAAYRDYYYKSQLQQEAYDLSASSINGVRYKNGDMKATDMEDTYYSFIDSGEYTEDEAIDYLLNQAKGDSERITFLANIGKDPRKYGIGTSSEPGQNPTPEDLKKKYPNVSEIARNTITNTDVLDKLEEFNNGDIHTTDDLKNLIKGMQAESDEAVFIGDVLDDIIINNSLHGMNKTFDDLSKGFNTDFGSSTNALNQSLNLIEQVVQALKEAGIDSTPTSGTVIETTIKRDEKPTQRSRKQQATSFEKEETIEPDLGSLRANYAASMYMNLVDKINNASDIDMTWLNFNDNTSDSKLRAGEEIIKRLNAIKDEDINEVKPMIISYINEKLIEPEQNIRKKAQEEKKKEEALLRTRTNRSKDQVISDYVSGKLKDNPYLN